MEALAAWWRARTMRERRLIQLAALLIFGLLAPAWVYLVAADFRRDAAAELASARRIESQVARLAEASRAQGEAPQNGDSSIRGRALAAAETARLAVASVEPSGPDRALIAFQPADSLAVYRWIETVGRRGVHVTKSSIVRVAESELVRAEFEVAANP